MRKIAILFLLVSFNFACNSETQTTPSGNVIINGKIINLNPGAEIFFEELGTRQVNPLGSTKIAEDGTFSVSFNVSTASYIRLRINQNNLTNIIASPNDKIELTANAQDLQQTLMVKGSEESRILFEFNTAMLPYFIKMDSLQRIAQQYQQQGNAMGMNSVYVTQMQLEELKRSIAANFLDKHSGTMAALAAVENLSADDDFPYYLRVVELMQEKHADSEHFQALKAKVESMKRLAPGSVAPDIVLNNPEGTTVALSTLKGKVVLIDFWASWCKPCRMENPNVVRLYNQYKNKGFEIYGVSLDKAQDAWLGAIKEDNLTWIHVSDLQFWNSAAAKLYNVSSIPQTFLLDAEGKIIGKNLRGEALAMKLKEVLGE
jgi:peroxiredoxin